MSAPRWWILGESSWGELRHHPCDLAVLPWGATEAHNYHLPYATDVIETEFIAAEAARLATAAGARVLVLPAIPFGVQAGQLDIPFCINLMPSTQAAVLADIVVALEGQGVKKLLLLNGHGGNDFKAMIRELQAATDVFLCTINWWSCVPAGSFFEKPGDHAGELETSVMLQIAPDLVRPLSEAGPGTARAFRLTGLREGWAWAPRQWTRTTSDTGVGDPAAATAPKGAAFLQAVTNRIAAFLTELAAADTADLYTDLPR
ncbi:MAG: creatininase family protein [Gemmatimonadetes bacterium]|nr:creatininase family protein [Gemmatimonadota bacterium]